MELLVRQGYLCKRCKYRYTVERKSGVKSEDVRRLALEMPLEGLGFRSIGRILKISYGTVYQWVKEWGSKVSLPQSEEPVVLVELDEMHTYVESEKNGKLHREFAFKDFSEAFGFMARVALLAESQGHHPDWSNSWNKVSISLCTHGAGDKITEKDKKLAAAIDLLA